MVAERRRWTPAEDALLRQEMELQERSPTGRSRRIDWNAIAMKIPGRSNKDCRKRFHNQFAGCGPWTPEEDNRLKVLVRKYRYNWAFIGQRMETRNADQCSKRWHHSLNPELERRPWADAENQLLLSAVNVHGTSWKDIQRGYFPTRSANNIKNQFTILSRRAGDTSISSTSAPSPASSSMSQNMEASTPTDVSFDHFLRLLPVEEPKDDNSLLTPDIQIDAPLRDALGEEPWSWNMDATGLSQLDDQGPIVNLPERDNTFINPNPELSTDLKLELPPWTAEADQLLDDYQRERESSPLRIQNTTFVPGSRSSAELSEDESSRITITVDGAEPDTIMTVMKILFQSNARVGFQRGQIDM
ncbi:hypothetical protein N7474_002851 [Penicillium riverlandense]|uniref:uncharacterized protein n=1 Tax=Penicillium riverlandense TaxID=1903569 RepID=UPI00254700F8|nr:uncharacterized protein N7474_002851 [Penicillium riverlandense]KAJ5825713.1 hypothetical protein N7474_002851 [Penicillium riverlandense]